MPNENLTKECNCFTLSLTLVCYGYCWYNLYAPCPFANVFVLLFCAECVLTRDIVSLRETTYTVVLTRTPWNRGICISMGSSLLGYI